MNLTSLINFSGPQGATGPTGPFGQTGTSGVTGVTGAQGISEGLYAGSDITNVSTINLTVNGGSEYTLPASTLSQNIAISLLSTGARTPYDGEMIAIDFNDVSANTKTVKDSAGTTIGPVWSTVKITAWYQYSTSTGLFAYRSCGHRS
jgi:hypothetical protein